jgi:hypothetical protein
MSNETDPTDPADPADDEPDPTAAADTKPPRVPQAAAARPAAYKYYIPNPFYTPPEAGPADGPGSAGAGATTGTPVSRKKRDLKNALNFRKQLTSIKTNLLGGGSPNAKDGPNGEGGEGGTGGAGRADVEPWLLALTVVVDAHGVETLVADAATHPGRRIILAAGTHTLRCEATPKPELVNDDGGWVVTLTKTVT